MLGTIAALVVSGDCGMCLRLDEVEDGVVGSGGVCTGSSAGDVVTVNSCELALRWICLVSPDGSWIIGSIIGVSCASGGGTRLGFGAVESPSDIGVSYC